MHQELGAYGLTVDTSCHEVVAAVAQHADDLGRQCLVEQLEHMGPVGAVASGDCAVLGVLARLLAQGLDQGQLVGGHGLHCLIMSSFLTLLAPSAAAASLLA